MLKGILIFTTGALAGVFLQQNYPLPNFKTEYNKIVKATQKPAEPAK
jgi:hypothetical protein